MLDVFDLFIALVEVLIWHAYFTCASVAVFFFFLMAGDDRLQSISIFHLLQVE